LWIINTQKSNLLTTYTEEGLVRKIIQ